MKLCHKVRKFLDQDMSLVTVRDQARGTLNLAVIKGNKVAEMKLDPKKAPKTDVIHLHKEIGDIIYNDLL